MEIKFREKTENTAIHNKNFAKIYFTVHTFHKRKWRYTYPLLEEAGLETWAVDFWKSYIKRPMVTVGPSLGVVVAIDFTVNYPKVIKLGLQLKKLFPKLWPIPNSSSHHGCMFYFNCSQNPLSITKYQNDKELSSFSASLYAFLGYPKVKVLQESIGAAKKKLRQLIDL
uniref:Uncharacterized protein n=1 Tax=Cucumis melo TaxID=3656 RepID=A0A9I9E4K0_CUCME